MGYAAKTEGYARNAGKRWRGSDVADLKRMVNRSMPLRVISLKLGRPYSAIKAKAGALGLEVDDAQPSLPLPSRPSETLRPRREPSRGEQLELFAG